MKYFKLRRILKKVSGTSVIVVGIPLIILTNCSRTTNTINPFYSSFEENSDHNPLINDITAAENVENLTTTVDTGPIHGYNLAKKTDDTGFGFTGFRAFEYACLSKNANQHTKFIANIYDNLNITIGKNTELSYKLFPNMGNNQKPALLDINYPAENIIVDLLINDSADTKNLITLSSLKLNDENGFQYTPINQGQSKILMNDQWNAKHVPLGALAGKHIHGIQLYYEFNTPKENEEIKGWIDDIKIADAKKINTQSLADYVDTTRGTDSSANFSRGCTIPITSLPNGFNFYTPFTNSETADWSYSYKQHNDSNNLPTINGFGVSHMPSPWISDYDRFTIMPQLADQMDYSANSIPNQRAIEFSHENEIAKPNYYGVTFNNKLKVELAPHDHSAIFRFTFPEQQNFGALIFDSVRNNQTNQDPIEKFKFNNNVVSGWVWNMQGANEGTTIMYIYGELSNANYTIHNTNEPNKQNLTFDLSQSKTIEFKFATSFISQEQAKRNLQMEINNNLNFDSLVTYAGNTWQNKLQAIDLSRSNVSQVNLVTMYSNLYRLNLYPNSHFENTGTKSNPIYQYASPVLPVQGDINDDYTNAQIRDGKSYVNNGFWDTYRTVWPLYQLLYPNFVNDLIGGFLLEYRDSGWISRWSSPGHNDSMTGTSSDAAFADAYTNNVISNITTAVNIYNAGMANAMQMPPNKYVGRKGFNQSLYLGYTPVEYGSDPSDQKTDSSADWSLQGYINDYALGKLAVKLGNDPKLTEAYANVATGQSKQQIIDTGNYLLGRSQNYSKLFWVPEGQSKEQGFFRGKFTNGTWAGQWQDPENPWAAAFDPESWGSEFVEEDGWNYAFSVPFDVNGLIGLYGGQENFINKLDTFFNTPETGLKLGNYGRWGNDFLYAMEARDVRMGQLGMNNQPSHHIPYMYAAAGLPSKTQALTREIIERLFIGNDIGQGYLGDEDNGEMSAWYILSSLGLYPLALGSQEYVITSPLFKNVQIKRDNGNHLNIVAINNNKNNKYIQSVKVDGNQYNDAYISSLNLLNNNHTIDFTMADNPTSWANKTITPTIPIEQTDVATNGTWSSSAAVTNLAKLIDQNTLTSAAFTAQTTELKCTYSILLQEKIINSFSLTNSSQPIYFNKIELYASNTEDKNLPILVINNQDFAKSYETKQYSFFSNQNYKNYWITLYTDDVNYNLSEIQLIC